MQAQTTLVPGWITRNLGKLVTVTRSYSGYPKGHRGLLLSVATKSRWGVAGVYATLAMDLRDLGDESNIELADLEPVRRG